VLTASKEWNGKLRSTKLYGSRWSVIASFRGDIPRPDRVGANMVSSKIVEYDAAHSDVVASYYLTILSIVRIFSSIVLSMQLSMQFYLLLSERYIILMSIL